MQQSLGCREAIYCVPTAGKRHLCRGGSTMVHRWNGFLLVALPHRKILPFCLDKQRGSMVNSYVLSFLFYSSKSAFSRHGIVQASLPLFIWLIKDVLSTACISLHRAYMATITGSSSTRRRRIASVPSSSKAMTSASFTAFAIRAAAPPMAAK